MSAKFKIISIGTLSKNPLWDEQEAVRTPHATTTLVITDKENILVDPSLPSRVLDARLYERAGIHIQAITTVFLTTFRAYHRMSIPAFDGAKWYIHEQEKEYAQGYLEDMLSRIRQDASQEQRRFVEDDLAVLKRCKAAPDKLADQVEIFPSPGASAGGCSLILTPPIGTVVIAGDAIISQEYLENGRVWDSSYDLDQARQSLRDVVEVADIIIPGHDNEIVMPGRFF